MNKKQIQYSIPQSNDAVSRLTYELSWTAKPFKSPVIVWLLLCQSVPEMHQGVIEELMKEEI